MHYFAMAAGDSERLQHELATLTEQKCGPVRWVALVDKAFDYDERGARTDDTTAIPIYHEGRFEALLPVSPVLIELPQGASFLDGELKRLVRHCRGKPMLSLLRLACSSTELRDSWQCLLELETEDQSLFVLRFADTRVLPTLASIDAIWNRLAASVSAWWIVGRDGRWQSLPQPQNRIFQHEPLVIDEDAYAHLILAGNGDAMAAYLNEHFPNLLTGRDGYANHLLLEKLAKLCESCRIDGSGEQFALAVVTMLTEGRLLEATGFTEWLAEKSWSAGGLEDALEEWMVERGLA